jgi:hypothetical protein
MMSLFSNLQRKLSEKILGVVIADFGTLPANEHGWTLSLTLRRKNAECPNLVFKWQSPGHTDIQSVAATPGTLEQLESIIGKARKAVQHLSSR